MKLLRNIKASVTGGREQGQRGEQGLVLGWLSSHMNRFTLWLLSSDGLEGSKSGIGKTVKRLLESRWEMKLAGTRVVAWRRRECFRLTDG